MGKSHADKFRYVLLIIKDRETRDRTQCASLGIEDGNRDDGKLTAMAKCVQASLRQGGTSTDASGDVASVVISQKADSCRF